MIAEKSGRLLNSLYVQTFSSHQPAKSTDRKGSSAIVQLSTKYACRLYSYAFQYPSSSSWPSQPIIITDWIVRHFLAENAFTDNHFMALPHTGTLFLWTWVCRVRRKKKGVLCLSPVGWMEPFHRSAGFESTHNSIGDEKVRKETVLSSTHSLAPYIHTQRALPNQNGLANKIDDDDRDVSVGPKKFVESRALPTIVSSAGRTIILLAMTAEEIGSVIGDVSAPINALDLGHPSSTSTGHIRDM